MVKFENKKIILRYFYGKNAFNETWLATSNKTKNMFIIKIKNNGKIMTFNKSLYFNGIL